MKNITGLISQVLGELSGIGSSVSKNIANTQAFEADKKAIEDYNNSDKEFWQYKKVEKTDNGLGLATTGIALGFVLLVVFLIIKNVKTSKK